MGQSRITILHHHVQEPLRDGLEVVIAFETFRRWILSGGIARHLFRYEEARLLTYRLETVPKPFLTAAMMHLLGRKACWIQDEQGKCLGITIRVLASLLWRFVIDLGKKDRLIRQSSAEVQRLSSNYVCARSRKKPLDLSVNPVYLRTDLAFGVRSGGSIGHIAGVLNLLDEFAEKPIFLTTDLIPTVRTDLETYCIPPERIFWDFKELPSIHFNEIFERNARNYLKGKKISFIYQRYSINNYSGLKLASGYVVPFVLEYNGSEIWMNRHWGRPLIFEKLSERIERLNLKAADVVVVVSEAMKQELLSRGIDPEKILVNPNGVDSEQYSPSVDGSAVRERYGLSGKIVIGFIGTFGKWHGAEVLAQSFGLLLRKFPEYKGQVRLLMIGDGVMMPEVKGRLERLGVSEPTILTGLIPQQEGPAHLAACDILVASHVPNPDGTPFFGSPTKLFEYMAMGKGIVASDLDQIGDILKHDQTAWLVKPGDAESLMLGLKALIDDEERRTRLGRSARQEVVAKYTWREHTRKMIEKLKECCG